MSVPFHRTTEQPPSAIETLERVAWRLRQQDDIVTALGFDIYAHEAAQAPVERFITVRERAAPGDAANVAFVTTPLVDVMAEVPHHLGENIDPRQLVAGAMRLVFKELNGWSPDDAAADAAFGGAMVHAAVLLPLRIFEYSSPVALDADEDRLYSTVTFTLTLSPNDAPAP